MKIINASYQRVRDDEFNNPLKKIERIARICYKSEDNITEDSYKKMTKALLSRRHLAMFEHSSLVFEVNKMIFQAVGVAAAVITTNTNNDGHIMNICRIHRTRTNVGSEERCIVSGNIRAFYEFFEKTVEFKVNNSSLVDLYWNVNSRIDNLFEIPEYDVPATTFGIKEITDMSILTPAERLIHETVSVIFTCDRGVTHELVRMRDASFAQESTRYCNYQLGKFGNEITVIRPCFFEENSHLYQQWLSAMSNAETSYNHLIAEGAKAQEARAVLPTSVKADIALTTNLHEWKHILNLRACDSTGPAHPQMKEIMVPLFRELKAEYPEILEDLSLPDEK